MIHKINVFILSIIIALVPAYVFAASTPEDIWLRDITKNVDSTGRTTGYTIDASKRTIVNGTARDMSSKLLDYKPNKAAVGGVMKKRLAQAVAGGGVAIIGLAAVDALLRGIGWIMKDGIYVKVHKPDDAHPSDPSVQYQYCAGGLFGDCVKQLYSFSDANSAAQATCKAASQTFSSIYAYLPNENNWTTAYIRCINTSGKTDDWNIGRRSNPNYDPNSPPPTEQKIPITDSELADIMFGDYQGDSSANIQPKNDGNHVGVQETMQPDPNAGEGTKDKPTNPVSEDIDQKLDNNPEKKTQDHKQTDSKGDEETTKEDGTKEQTKTETKTELPAFCNYAAFLCKHIEWMESEVEPPTEPTEIDTKKKRDVEDYGIDMPTTFNTDRFRVNDQCPAPISTSFQLNGTQTFSLSLEPVCNILGSIKPVMIGCGYLYAAFIVTGAAKE